MKNYLLILPVALLVTYSQLIVKWRASANVAGSETGWIGKIIAILSDPVILSAYGAALLASFAWLYVITKLPLTIAFPVYVGATVALVMLGSWFFLAESITPVKLLAVSLIFAGIVLGVSTNG